MAHGVGNNDVGAVLKQISLVKISNVFARGATLFDSVVVYTMAANGDPGVTSTIALLKVLGRWKAVLRSPFHAPLWNRRSTVVPS